MLLVLSSLALATQLDMRTEGCPTGNGVARVYSKVSANTHGGWDSDLVSYSTEGQFREYAISTCPDDLFTVYGHDMDMVLTDEQKTAVEVTLAGLRREIEDPEKLEVWERYIIAGQVYKTLGADHRQLYQLYLEASWTARDKAVGVYKGLEGPIAAWELLEQGDAELKRTDLDAHTRKILLHNLARVAHRGGFANRRDGYLKQFEAVGDLDAEEKKALQTMRWIVTDVEPKLQQLAMAELQAYLATEPSDTVGLMRATYLLADLYRRQGDMGVAVQGYALVAVHPDAPQQLKDLSAWFGSMLSQ